MYLTGKDLKNGWDIAVATVSYRCPFDGMLWIEKNFSPPTA